MRPALLMLLALVLAACTEGSASRVDERTFRVEGPQLGLGTDAPNRRLANRLCPKGFRVLDTAEHKGGPDRAHYESGDAGSTTVWTIRCI
jgi:hypothetical protein